MAAIWIGHVQFVKSVCRKDPRGFLFFADASTNNIPALPNRSLDSGNLEFLACLTKQKIKSIEAHQKHDLTKCWFRKMKVSTLGASQKFGHQRVYLSLIHISEPTRPY